ncbi:MAG: hypothetical protein GY830_01910 [Bacteroidetes bacterium]|nr:hypothetical protein [Bacteroidota bacterium]
MNSFIKNPGPINLLKLLLILSFLSSCLNSNSTKNIRTIFNKYDVKSDFKDDRIKIENKFENEYLLNVTKKSYISPTIKKKYVFLASLIVLFMPIYGNEIIEINSTNPTSDPTSNPTFICPVEIVFKSEYDRHLAECIKNPPIDTFINRTYTETILACYECICDNILTDVCNINKCEQISIDTCLYEIDCLCSDLNYTALNLTLMPTLNPTEPSLSPTVNPLCAINDELSEFIDKNVEVRCNACKVAFDLDLDFGGDYCEKCNCTNLKNITNTKCSNNCIGPDQNGCTISLDCDCGFSCSPTYIPTNDPTNDPTFDPTNDPTNYPTMDPTNDPTDYPTNDPTKNPTFSRNPTTDPTNDPTTDPTNDPTADPTNDPTNDPTADPTNDPTNDPAADPTNDPTTDPTSDPTIDPTNDPSNDPTVNPTKYPTTDPSNNPTIDSAMNPVNLESKKDDDSSLAIILPIVLGVVGGFIVLLILIRLIKRYVSKQYLNVGETEYDLDTENI